MSLRKLLNLQRPFVIFDLETTGGPQDETRIVEFGMRVHRPDSDEVDSYRTLVNPLIPIPKEAVEVHHISDEIIATCCARCIATPEAHPHATCESFRPVPTFSDIAPSLYRGFSNADFCGYNVKNYDLPVMRAEFQRVGLMFDYRNAAIIDGFRIWQILEPRTLSDAVEHFLKRKHRGAHGALADVEETEDVVISQLTTHPRTSMLQKDTVQSLGDQCFTRDPSFIDMDGKFKFINGEPCINFGKHKGEPMRKIRGYLQWMVDKGNFNADVQEICRKALAGDFPKPNGDLLDGVDQ